MVRPILAHRQSMSHRIEAHIAFGTTHGHKQVSSDECKYSEEGLNPVGREMRSRRTCKTTEKGEHEKDARTEVTETAS